MPIAQACLKNVSPYNYWSLADPVYYPHIASRMQIQIRLMGKKIRKEVWRKATSLNFKLPFSLQLETYAFEVVKDGRQL